MYFWRIEKLKAEMAARPLSEREVLPYLVIFIAFLTAASYFPEENPNLWDGLSALWSTALAVLGTIYIYRQNGGSAGHYFLQRYFAIGWVVTVRWLVIIVVGAIVCFGLIAALGGETEQTTWYHFVIFALIEVLIYWRIGHHVRDLAQRTKAA